jgi:hypothetical protein
MWPCIHQCTIHWKLLMIYDSIMDEAQSSIIELFPRFQFRNYFVNLFCFPFAFLGDYLCRNPSLGLTTKARAYKIAGRKRNPGSESKCEGMKAHTPKGTSTLGVGVPVDSWMFREWLPGSKHNGLRSSLYYWKVMEHKCLKWAHMKPFGHLKHKLWPKEGLGVKLSIWLPTAKSQESTRFPYVQVACDIPLKRSWRGLQLCFKHHLNRRSSRKVMRPQSCGNPNFGNFGIPTGRPGTKCHLDVGLMEKHKLYYKGEGGGFPQVQAVVSLVNPNLPVVHPNTKSAPTMH